MSAPLLIPVGSIIVEQRDGRPDLAVFRPVSPKALAVSEAIADLAVACLRMTGSSAWCVADEAGLGTIVCSRDSAVDALLKRLLEEPPFAAFISRSPSATAH